MVHPDTPAANTQYQSRVLTSDEKIKHLSNQLLDLTKQMSSMQIVLTNLPTTVEKMVQASSQGKTNVTELGDDSGTPIPKSTIILTNKSSSSSFLPLIIHENHFDSSLFSLPKVKLP